MNKIGFFFVASFLLLLPLVLSNGEMSASNQLALCVPFILLLGIPHGAIDNRLFLRDKKIKNAHFIALYVAVIFLNIGLWLLFPLLAYGLFLIISAYHFGQSQFAQYFKKPRFLHHTMAMSWGICVLSGLIFFNMSEVHDIMSIDENFNAFNVLHQKTITQIVFGLSSGLTLLILFFFLFSKKISLNTVLKETFILFLILFSFKVLPFLIGFTLYFVILHSIKVLQEEFTFLMLKKEIYSWKHFIALLAPLTILSLLGIAFVFISCHFEIISLSYGYCLMMIISSITLPHVFVMDRFYSLFSSSISV